MDKRNWCRLIFFLITALAAVAYPVFKIINYELPSVPPAVYRFKAGIVDPYDPFRGRYVALNALPNEIILKEEKKFQDGAYVYAVLSNDKQGIATVVDLVEKPIAKMDCLKIRFYEYGNSKDKAGRTIYRISLPFDRFYLNESIAPEAEKAVADITRINNGECLIIVKVYADGNYAIEDLEINGQSIHKYLKNIARE